MDRKKSVAFYGGGSIKVMPLAVTQAKWDQYPPITPMYYCGIDIGTEYIGWALLYEDGEVADCGTWKLEGNLDERLVEVKYRASTLFALNHDIRYVGIEEPWVGPNSQVAIKLSKAWGIVLACSLPIRTIGISAGTAKRVFTGNGRASKEVVMEKAKGLFPEVDSQDAADAIAVAYAVRESFR